MTLRPAAPLRSSIAIQLRQIVNCIACAHHVGAEQRQDMAALHGQGDTY
jgi:hypothetical protein